MSDIFNPAFLTRPDLSSLKPYEADNHPGLIKMDANENPYDFPREIMKEICLRMNGRIFSRYPDPMAGELVNKLSLKYGVDPGGIMAGNGSDELILDLMLAFGGGGKVVITGPTFAMYMINARIAGAVPVEVARTSDFAVDINKTIEAAKGPGTRMVIICSPNNPTGNDTDVADIENILQSCPSVLVVVDEAYAEFSGRSCAALLDKYKNLVILRTFSKAYGLAGLRVGYMLTHRETINEIKRIKQPFNLNAFSQVATLTVLEYIDSFKEQVQAMLRSQRTLKAELDAIPGVKTFPTVTNFILFNTARSAAGIHKSLMEKGVLIRNCSGPGLENCLRVSVGRDEENRLFIKYLKEALNL